MATLTNLGTANLSLKGAGDSYNNLSRLFATKAEADAALALGAASGGWVPVAGRVNAALTGDQGLLIYNHGTTALDNADSATRAYVDAQLSALTGDAPALLNTLGEISDALNDDPNFFTTAAAARTANTALINAETARATAAEAAVQADVNSNEADADTAIAAVQADVDANEAAALTARNAIQADVDQNESDADAAIAAVQADVNQNETDADAAIAAQNTAMLAAVAVVQADVNQNETDADAAIAAVQADVDQNEADGDAALAAEKAALLIAIAVVQNDVNTNESDADTAIAAVQSDVDANEVTAANLVTAQNTAMLAAVAAVQADVDQNESDADTALATKAPLASPALTGTPTSPTASQGSGTTQIATTAYVDTAVATLIDSSPGALDTLNELAAAIADDASFSTTITNSIAAVQADVNQNEVDADAAIAAVQTDVDANEVTAAGLVTAQNTAMLAAVAVVQADVNQNETDADAAIAVVQADVNQNESDADAAIAAVQADVDQNESDADAAIAAVQADVDQNESDADAAIVAAEARNEVHIDNVASLLGIAKDGVNFSSFTGSTISDNQTLKTILQSLETAVEGRLQTATGGQVSGNLTLRKSDGSAVALQLSRADHADMNVVWKVQPSYVSADKEVLTVLANGQIVAHFDERQRFAINMNDPDYTLDVGGDGHFSTNLVVGGSLTLGSTAVTSTAAELNILDGVTSTAAELNILDGVTSTATEINLLDGVTATTTEINYIDVAAVGTAEASKALVLDAGKSITGINQLTCVDLTVTGTTTTVDTVTMQATNAIAFEGATADSSEITLTTIDPTTDRTIKLPNQSGCVPLLAVDSNTQVTATPEELNILDGATLTVAELNILDGVTSTAAELNLLDGVTATTTEINYIDGVTSAIQTQLNAIQSDVDGNESDADTAIAANETHIDNAVTLTGVAKDSTHLATFTGSTINNNVTIKAALQALETKVEAVQSDVDTNESDADTAIALKSDIAGPTFTGVPAAPTASAGTNTTQIATTAFVTTAVANTIDGAPGALDTLNELAAALNDDANFSTTVTNLINANETHIDNAVTLTGVAKDAVNLGTFTGSTVSDARTIKQAIQELETKAEAIQTDVDGNESDADTAIAANETHIDNMATLTGVAKDATNIGNFTGSTISDGGTMKAGIQELETAVETKLNTSGAKAALDVDHLITLSGVAAAADNLGSFSGSHHQC